jgi:hypothetical protein
VPRGIVTTKNVGQIEMDRIPTHNICDHVSVSKLNEYIPEYNCTPSLSEVFSMRPPNTYSVFRSSSITIWWSDIEGGPPVASWEPIYLYYKLRRPDNSLLQLGLAGSMLHLPTRPVST